MKDPHLTQAVTDPLPDRLKQYLSETAKRELDLLRGALEERLLALETALAHPDQHDTLDDLVLALGRVITAEVEASAAKGWLEAQIQAQEQVRPERARPRESGDGADLEDARAEIRTLRFELEQAKKELEHEHVAGAARDRELDQLRAHIRNERESGGASRLDAEVARTEAQTERRRVAALERELADAKRAAESLAVDADAHFTGTVTTLERRCADLERELTEAQGRAEAAEGERNQVAAELDGARLKLAEIERDADAFSSSADSRVADAERRAAEAETRATGADTRASATEMRAATAEARAAEADQRAVAAEARAQAFEQQAAAAAARGDAAEARATEADRRAAAADARAAADNARMSVAEAERTAAEQVRGEAESRASGLVLELGAIQTELEEARRDRDAGQTAADARYSALTGERASLEGALKDAETRLADVERARAALAAELATARQQVAPAADSDLAKRLEAADARVRALELQLFGRGKHDPDVELSTLLAPEPTPGERPQRSASRYNFPASTEARVDGETGALVDLSVTGAQVICYKELELDRIVTLTLPSDETPVSAQGKIVWTRIEPHKKGKPLRCRTGILFTSADEAAVEAFIIRYAV